MNNTINKPYHPKNHQELVKKYRQVSPIVLHPEPSTTSARRSAPNAGLELYAGAWTDDHRAHLLKRCMFGMRKADLQAFSDLNVSEAVDQLFTIHSVSPPVNNYNVLEDAEDPDVPFGETWTQTGYGNDWEGPRTVSLKTWLAERLLTQPATLEEKMIFFWHNLLPIQTWDVFYAKLSYGYFDMLRRNVFGNFKTIIRELTLNPAMLLFLNGTFNNKEAPDENYGRELQELFCIGKGPNANFTEDDVQAAARVLTGWVVDWEEFESDGELGVFFYPPFHETSDKQFSAFYDNRLIKGRTGDAGAEELDELLEMIFDNPETALYICRRLYQFFVYPEITEQVEEDIIAPLAQLFRDHDYEVRPVLEKLLKSAHFHDEANHGTMIKSPAEYIIGLWRTLEVEGLPADDLTLRAQQNRSLVWNMANLGMELGDPPSVSGWPAYYQEPSFDKYWITTDTIANRAIMSDSLVYWGFWLSEEHQIPADLIFFLTHLDDPGEPNNMLREAGQLLLGIRLDEDTLLSLKKILLGGQESDGYWTTAWAALMSNPDNEEYRSVVENRLKPTFQHLLQLGEAQLM